MTTAISCVEFSFNNRIDSPLGPALANIFVGYYENKLFACNSIIFLYQKYVDDIFSIFTNETQSNQFFAVLNSLHPLLRFTVEKEKDGVPPHLDVKIEKSSNEFKSLFTENLHLLDYIQTGILLNNKKLILLVLLFTVH